MAKKVPLTLTEYSGDTLADFNWAGGVQGAIGLVAGMFALLAILSYPDSRSITIFSCGATAAVLALFWVHFKMASGQAARE